jgi:phospholipid/cholesterol/gamma-HCH transport system substrate-binding protein
MISKVVREEQFAADRRQPERLRDLLCRPAFGLIAVFANLRFSEEQHYKAEFADVSGLEVNDFVRIAGVEVGQVKGISINKDAVAVVEFTADPKVKLTESTKAQIRWENPIGDRYLVLQPGLEDAPRLQVDGTIPAARTEPALDLDTLLGGFRPLFRALDPEQVNNLSNALIRRSRGGCHHRLVPQPGVGDHQHPGRPR